MWLDLELICMFCMQRNSGVATHTVNNYLFITIYFMLCLCCDRRFNNSRRLHFHSVDLFLMQVYASTLYQPTPPVSFFFSSELIVNRLL